MVGKQTSLARRSFLRFLGAALALSAGAGKFFFAALATAESASGLPLPDEKVEATLKRLFGSRPLYPADGRIKLELPSIAEDGGNVSVAVDADLPMSPATYVKNLYVISDKNRRPLLAKFSFTPEAGKAYIATNIRLATTTDVRAVAEMSDGALYAVSRHVRVTISGCDLPPQG
jgi:sulfur-oxidizing protein SoxY